MAFGSLSLKQLQPFSVEISACYKMPSGGGGGVNLNANIRLFR